MPQIKVPGISLSPRYAGNPLFFDDFNYVVTNDSADAVANEAAFAAAGWSEAKGLNTNEAGSAGNVYTELVSSIPGFSGSAPSLTSSRALCLNSLAYTLSSQSDMYLGSFDNGNREHIPGDVWFQFWIYPCRSGAQQTQFHRKEKFLYPSNDSYGSHTDKWIWWLRGDSEVPTPQVFVPEAGSAFGGTSDTAIATYDDFDNGEPDKQDNIHQNLSTSDYMEVNTWTLVKIHYDTSTIDGVYEMWLKPQGGVWVKVAAWINGVDGFVWTVDSAHRDGHQQFRLGTTFPGADVTPLYDAWVYLQDFCWASSESNLPTY